MADPKKPTEEEEQAKPGHTTSEALGQAISTPLHDQVFGSDPDGGVNDTPPGAIGSRVVLLNPGAVTDGFQPMLKVGDTDRNH